MNSSNKYIEYSPSRLNQVIKFIENNHINNNFSLLEFGTGSGSTLKDFKVKFPKAFLCGFDAYPNLVDSIVIYKEDLNKFNISKYKRIVKSADYLLFLDVLEHLLNPFDFLSKIIFISKQNSKVIISCPNFLSVRMFSAWLSGRLPLADHGFFDKTHLRWLSPVDFVIFFDKNNFSNIHFEYIFSKNFFLKFLQKLYPSRLCSQFIFVATK